MVSFDFLDGGSLTFSLFFAPFGRPRFLVTSPFVSKGSSLVSSFLLDFNTLEAPNHFFFGLPAALGHVLNTIGLKIVAASMSLSSVDPSASLESVSLESLS